mmetsp:Transcript_46601/g.116543  ORF Transcript_46601/g.116543 Transcript_46601/m.116543 type:complete len:265 (+) Transcript_46601:461-1255(+)
MSTWWLKTTEMPAPLAGRFWELCRTAAMCSSASPRRSSVRARPMPPSSPSFTRCARLENSAMLRATPSMVSAWFISSGAESDLSLPPSGTLDGCCRARFALARAAARWNLARKRLPSSRGFFAPVPSVDAASDAGGLGRHSQNPSYQVSSGSRYSSQKLGRLRSRNHLQYGWKKGASSHCTSTVASTTTHHCRKNRFQPWSCMTRLMEPYGQARTSTEIHTHSVLNRMTRHLASSGCRSAAWAVLSVLSCLSFQMSSMVETRPS